jgi:hypothetical protein
VETALFHYCSLLERLDVYKYDNGLTRGASLLGVRSALFIRAFLGERSDGDGPGRLAGAARAHLRALGDPLAALPELQDAPEAPAMPPQILKAVKTRGEFCSMPFMLRSSSSPACVSRLFGGARSRTGCHRIAAYRRRIEKRIRSGNVMLA